MKQLKDISAQGGIYPMGLTVLERQLHISVAWGCESCSLVLYEPANWEAANHESDSHETDNLDSVMGAAEHVSKYPMNPEYRQGYVWNLTLESDESWPDNLQYCLEVDGRLEPDPYAKRILGWEQWGDAENTRRALRSPVFQEEFDWEGDQPLNLPYEDCVIYKAHVRGLTMDEGARYKDKGTFKGMIGKIPYLKEMGITTLELMPVIEFCEQWKPGKVVAAVSYVEDSRVVVDKKNYWGYCGGYYFAPKAAYSSDSGCDDTDINTRREKNPVCELKQLVKELHKAGLELVLQFYFDGSEAPGFVLDVIRYWAREYHLDGIHLVGAVPMQQISRDPYIGSIKLWADNWYGADSGMLLDSAAGTATGFAGNGQRSLRRLAEYNDAYRHTMRGFLKGDENQVGNAAYVSHRNPADIAVINYMAGTNGYTLADMVTYQEKHNEANGENNQDGAEYDYSWNCGVEGPSRKRDVTELRRKQLRNAALMLFLSQGTPLLQAGDEFLNTQLGNNNAYCQDNEIGWVNWKATKAGKEYQQFVKECIAFRKAHPIFNLSKPLTGKDISGCGLPDISWHGLEPWKPQFEDYRRELAVMYCGEYGRKADGSRDEDIYVIYNMYWEPQIFGLPKPGGGRRWHLVIDTGRSELHDFTPAGEEILLEEQRNYTAVPRSVIVFIAKKW